MPVQGRSHIRLKTPIFTESAGSVSNPARASMRGPSILSAGLVSAVFARAVIAQALQTFTINARGGFPPWEGGREIRRHVTI